MGSTVSPTSTPTRVLVIGGSYAGLGATINLLDLCSGNKRPTVDLDSDAVQEGTENKIIDVKINIVDERDGFYHLIGSPLALSSKAYSEKAWVPFSEIPALQNPVVRHIQGSVNHVDFKKKVAVIKDAATQKEYEEGYDYLVAASGLRRVFPVVPQSIGRKEYLAEAEGHIEKVKNAKEGVVVIGGGAVGIEMAAELKLVEPIQKITLIHSRSQLLSSEPLPDEIKERSLTLLRETGVEVLLDHRVVETKPLETDDGAPLFELTFGNGEKMVTSHAISAISRSVPTTSYFPKEVLDEEGLVKITSNLTISSTEMPNATHHFAIGDLVSWSGIKRCGAAMHMGHFAAVNIHQQLLASKFGITPKFDELPEIPPMIALAVGKVAISSGPEGVKWGKEVMKHFFEEDLGFQICWNILRLSEDTKGGQVDKIEAKA